jgi:hypothetical protein
MTQAMSRVVLAAAVVCLTAAVSLAQPSTSTSTATKAFEVLAVSGNTLDVRLPEGTRELTVPDDFRFTVNGQPLSVHDLKPGMKGTATITTKTTVTPVTVTEVKNGTVMQRSGSSIIVRTDEGIKMFSQGELDKRGVKMVKDGQPAELTDFREGDKLSATIITSKPPKVMTEQQVNATLATGGAASGGAAGTRASSSSASRQGQASQATAGSSGSAGSAGSAGAAPKKLPKTASSWPLLALASIVSLVMGLTLTITRRFVH